MVSGRGENIFKTASSAEGSFFAQPAKKRQIARAAARPIKLFRTCLSPYYVIIGYIASPRSAHRLEWNQGAGFHRSENGTPQVAARAGAGGRKLSRTQGA